VYIYGRVADGGDGERVVDFLRWTLPWRPPRRADATQCQAARTTSWQLLPWRPASDDDATSWS